ncbi:transcriptional regulator [Citromicrobium sp. RCC1885]|jgi:prophage regulatory protein|uniref:AlpA family transcriptional regulator n=1 Tax=Erythrobacter westpacificensis TaxID=1055231 RepID=A0ABP9KQ05_9SPHN|nr:MULTISPECIES: AlpA family transcriptional regulator [unclassified Citromicrobium]KPM21543.1 transcriptional regulator [Citromicrobium sp. RCC1885]KPM23532.1 transcriptional regulator [Citromicrobium sp. RCC1878]
MYNLNNTAHCESDRPTRLIRIREVQHRVGLGRSTIYRWMAEGRFPKPVQLGGRSVGWTDAQIEAWIQDKRNAGTG